MAAGLRRHNKIHINHPFVVHLFFSPVNGWKKVFDGFSSGCRDVDAAWFAMFFKTGSEVHCIAPNVVGEFVFANYTCHDGTRVNANSHFIELRFGVCLLAFLEPS